MVKPNFFIVGAPRAGTTTLYYTLRKHPEVFFPDKKEPDFFSENGNFDDTQEYLSLYSNGAKCKVRGDASTSYFYQNGAFAKISNFSDQVQFLVQLRDPVDRALSQYKLRISRGLEEKSFPEACARDAFRLRNGQADQAVGYIYRGLYFKHLSRLFAHFGPESVKITLFRDFTRQPNNILSETCHFLDIDSSFNFGSVKKYNASTKSRSTLLSSIVNEKTSLKKIAKLFIPKKVASRFSSIVRYSLNRSPEYPDTDVSKKDLRRVRLFFSDDIQALDDLIDLDVRHWLVQ